MKVTLIWCVLFVGVMLLLGNTADAWNRQIFNRYSRNLLRRNGNGGHGIGNGNGNGPGNVLSMDGDGITTELENTNSAYDEFNTLFGRRTLATGQQPQTAPQPEVYGIVEPLIEDTPCADRACNVNDDCCPTGVCVNTYGEGRCVYVYGRKRELCQRNTDCSSGNTCQRDGISGLWFCQEQEFKQFGDECISSSNCNIVKGMCCQLQRSHHHAMPKKMCAYFRHPFVCIENMPNENEELHNMRYLPTAYNQQRM